MPKEAYDRAVEARVLVHFSVNLDNQHFESA
jgi:hypothetical protein